MAKGGRARDRYLAKVNYNRQVAQVNQLYQAKLASGMTRGQAATAQAGDTELAQSLGLPGYQPGQSRGGDYVVKDGDNITKIADSVGTTPDAILASNPDLTSPKTGMVINTPAKNNSNPAYMQYSQQTPQTVATQQPLFAANEQKRAQSNIGGLPSNAALGGLTNNPQGTNPGGVNAGMLAYSQSISQQSKAIDQTFIDARGNIQNGNPFLQNQYSAAGRPQVQPAGGPIPGVNYPQQQAQQNTQINPMPSVRKFPPLGDSYFNNQFKQVIENGMYPPQDMIDYGLRTGLIKKSQTAQSPQTSYGGGGSSYRRSRGGGGGGRGRGGGYGGGSGYPQQTQRPFSSDAGFKGLINWRI